MGKNKNPFSHIKIKYQRSSALVKCVVLTAVILCTIALLALRFAILDTEEKAENLKNESANLEQENDGIIQRIQELGTVESIKDLAGKLLGLVDPDTVIFIPEE